LVLKIVEHLKALVLTGTFLLFCIGKHVHCSGFEWITKTSLHRSALFKTIQRPNNGFNSIVQCTN